MNMVVLIGRLVRDPSYSEVETEKGKYHIASFYLAVPRNFNKGVNYIKLQLLENRQISQEIT